MTGEQMPSVPPSVLPYADRVRLISTEEPFHWLIAGWRDLRSAGWVSIAYGLIFVIAGLALTAGLYAAGYEYLIAPLIGGFLLVGPALTVGLYAISRDLEERRGPHFARALTAWRSNPVPLVGLGLGLVLFLIIWLRLAVVIFAMTFPYQGTSLKEIVEAALFTGQGYVFLTLGTVIGAVMASLAFAMSVFSLPMLLDRKVGLLEAVASSVVAVVLNMRAMALWAALIVLFTMAGLITGYLGLAVTLPLIGHASWHAYRSVINIRQ